MRWESIGLASMFALAACGRGLPTQSDPDVTDATIDGRVADADQASSGAAAGPPVEWSDPEIGVRAYLARLNVLLCRFHRECCLKSGDELDTDDCDSVDRSALDVHANLVASGDILFDPEAAWACLGSFAADHRCFEPGPDVCRRAIEGTVEPDEPCDHQAACAGGGEPTYCWTPISDERVCVRLTRATRGEPCDLTCGDAACRRRGSVVERSSAYCPADDGLYCNHVSGRCEPLLQEGAACESWSCFDPHLDAECEVTDCAAGLACSPATDRCTGRPVVGQTCDDDLLCHGGYCRDGTCVAHVAPGEPCESTGPWDQCGPYRRCGLEGRCVGTGSALGDLYCRSFRRDD